MKTDAYLIYKKIEYYIRDNAMIAQGDGIIVGVSGGADSMCLLRILCGLREEHRLRLVAVHVHHGIRGADADEDEAFVRAECGRFGVLCKVVHADVPALARKWGCSQEEAGRRVRYGAFSEAAAAHGCRKIAVAHNENDNAETFLFQAFRGSGFRGLAGIAPCRTEGGITVIRPLLGVGRAQIEAYLAAVKGAYRTDTTNFTLDYARNRIRNEILPLAQQFVNEGAVRHLAQVAAELHEMAGFLEEMTAKSYRDVAREAGILADSQVESPASARPAVISLDALAWEALPSFLQKEVVLYAIERAAGSRRDIGRVHVQSLCTLMRSGVGKRVQLPYGLLAIRTYDAVQLVREAVWDGTGRARQDFFPAFPEADFPRVAPGYTLTITSFPAQIPLGAYKLTLKLLEYGTEEFSNMYNSFCRNTGCQSEAKDGKMGGDKASDAPFSKKQPSLSGAQEQKIEKNSLNPKNCYTKCFDYAKIRNTLVLRTRQTGDYVVIHREGNTKSLKSLLIDQKVPEKCRDVLPILAAENSVLWAVGVRSGEGFYVTGNTKQILVAELGRKDRNCNGRED